MQVESIAEYSFGTFCKAFDLYLAIIGLQNQFLLFFSAMLYLVMLNIFTFLLFFFILFTCNLFSSRVKKIADRDQMASFSSGYTVFSKQDSRTNVIFLKKKSYIDLVNPVYAVPVFHILDHQ